MLYRCVKDLEIGLLFWITEADSKCYHKCPYKKEAVTHERERGESHVTTEAGNAGGSH
jgi:hypothetical protein